MAMNEPFELEAVPRRVMHLIFLVDTSGSMEGTKIASLNTAVRETLNDVGEISANNGDAQIKVAVLEFSSGTQWMYPQPEPSENFKWQDLEANGLTSLGAAYSELNAKLSKSNGFMAEPTGSRAPAMILLTDGIHAEKSRVVTGQGVLLAGVAQTHQKMGDGGGGGSGLVLFKPLENVENVGHVDSFMNLKKCDI